FHDPWFNHAPVAAVARVSLLPADARRVGLDVQGVSRRGDGNERTEAQQPPARSVSFATARTRCGWSSRLRHGGPRDRDGRFELGTNTVLHLHWPVVIRSAVFAHD